MSKKSSHTDWEYRPIKHLHIVNDKDDDIEFLQESLKNKIIKRFLKND